MAGHRFLTDPEFLRDCAVHRTGCDKAQDFDFPLTQERIVLRLAHSERRQTREFGLGAQAFECTPGGSLLEGGGVAIVKREASARSQRTSSGGVIRGVKFGPDRVAATQGDKSFARFATC